MEIFETHRGVYGSPRIHAALQDQGVHCGRKRIIRLMQQEKLSAHCRTHRVVTTRSNPQAQVSENVLDRVFCAERPNQKWVADVTYVATATGWMYLAAVLDLFSRRIVGWAMATTQDEKLVEQAYRAFLKQHDIQVSMSRKGNCWDNAVMERFFGTLKRECTSRVRFASQEQAHSAVFEYIECFI